MDQSTKTDFRPLGTLPQVTHEQLVEWLIEQGTLDDEIEFAAALLEEFVMIKRDQS